MSLNLQDATAAQLASAFSPTVMRSLSRAGTLRVTPALRAVAATVSDNHELTLGDAFDHAMQLLRRHYRSEYVFKNALVSKIIMGRHSPHTASALLEQQIGNSWADVMILNGTSTIYEIKTDLDQFSRLAKQLREYSTRAELVYLVTSDKALNRAERHIPDHVGLLALRGNGALSVIRSAKSGINCLQKQHLFDLLRAKELQAVLKTLYDYSPPAHSARAHREMRELFEEADVYQLHAAAVSALRERGGRGATLVLNPRFPKSLRALAYATSFSEVGSRRLLERLNEPASLFMGS